MRNYFLVLSAMLLLFVSCSKVPEKIAVTGVSLTATELELAPGETFPLKAAVIPGNASNKDVSWTSAVPSVAMVTDAGLVTALETGASTITVTTADGGFRASCSVIVKKQTIHVQSVSLSLNAVSLDDGGSVILSATVLPANAEDRSVSWSASPSSVITVEQDGFNGIVKAAGPGEGTVTVTTNDGGFSASCTVIVNEVTVNVESVTLDPESLELIEGETAAITATVLPEDATDKTLSWQSLNPDVATVDDEGMVTAVSAGETEITATSIVGVAQASCKVTVKKIQVDGVTVTPSVLTLQEGETSQLAATVSPSTAEQTVEWASSDSKVAAVDAQTGLVQAVAPGTARVYARSAAFPDKQGWCDITVTPDATLKGIELSSTVMTLQVGESRTLSVSFKPDYAANKNVSWASDNPSVASVDKDGKVSAFSEGSASITATAEDGGYTATCAVTVSGSAGPLVYYWKNSTFMINGTPDPRSEMFDTKDFYRSKYDPGSGIALSGNTLYTLENWYEKGLLTLWLCRDREPLVKLPLTSQAIRGFQVNEKGFALLAEMSSTTKVSLITGDFGGNYKETQITGSFVNFYQGSMVLYPDGKVTFATHIKDSYSNHYLAVYDISSGGEVSEKLLEQNQSPSPRLALDGNGDLYMLFFRYENSVYKAVLYKNGEQEAVLDEVHYNYRLDVAAAGGHVYTAVRDRDAGKVFVRKDKELVFTLSTDKDISPFDQNPMTVTPSGSVYLALRSTGGSALYRDSQLLFSSSGAWEFSPYAVKE